MPNSLDAKWKIDVKKASSQPPFQVRERLGRIFQKHDGYSDIDQSSSAEAFSGYSVRNLATPSSVKGFRTRSTFAYSMRLI